MRSVDRIRCATFRSFGCNPTGTPCEETFHALDRYPRKTVPRLMRLTSRSLPGIVFTPPWPRVFLWAAFLAIWIAARRTSPRSENPRRLPPPRSSGLDVYNGTRMKALPSQGIVDPENRQGKQTIRTSCRGPMPEEMRRQLQTRRRGGDEVRISFVTPHRCLERLDRIGRPPVNPIGMTKQACVGNRPVSRTANLDEDG